MNPEPSRLHDHLGYWLRKLSNQVSGSFAARIAAFGVTMPQWVVLRVLYDRGTLALKEIVAQVEMDQGGISRMVDRLLELELVTRVSDPRDRRAVAISLTEAGRQLVPQLARAADENEREFFACLHPQQQKELLQTIKTLLAHSRTDEKHVTD